MKQLYQGLRQHQRQQLPEKESKRDRERETACNLLEGSLFSLFLSLTPSPPHCRVIREVIITITILRQLSLSFSHATRSTKLNTDTTKCYSHFISSSPSKQFSRFIKTTTTSTLHVPTHCNIEINVKIHTHTYIYISSIIDNEYI